MQQFFHYDVPAGENTFNGCLGCAHGDSIVTSQWQFVSLTKRRFLPLMEKLYTENKKPCFGNGRLFSNGKPVPQATIEAFLA